MQKITTLVCLVCLLTSCHQAGRYKYALPEIGAEDLKFAPECYENTPGLPSPAITSGGREVVLLKTKDDKFIWMDATVENGGPFDYKRRLYGKGNQLLADEEDFPQFARTGLHSEKELQNTKLITGLSVAKITVDARPWGSSGVGFIAKDETIMSVIYGDNRMVKKLGLTHPDIARPLFHFWNIMHDFDKFNFDSVSNKRLAIRFLMYNSYELEFEVQGSRGWQESIFNDEILGTGHIRIWRTPGEAEDEFLKQHYGQLTFAQFEELKQKLLFLHTGEMVLFYINRYGFYEGHNEYRVDPVTVAFLFGLRSLEALHQACDGDLYSYFNTHFTENPE